MTVSSITIFSLEYGPTPNTIRMKFAAANEYVLDIEMEPFGADMEALVAELCRMGPILMRLDAALADYYDDAGRTKLPREDLKAVRDFRRLYGPRITEGGEDLEAFDIL